MPVRKTSSNDTDRTQEDQGANVDSSGRKENVFGTLGPARDYFGGAGYRAYQRETIEEIESAYEQGYKYVIVDAPTGSGKSHVARALAFQSNDAHIITVQKLLQDQYQSDFTEMFVMKGRSAYPCLESDSHESCATGPCQRRKGPGCPTCPYKLAKDDALEAAVTVHNFDSFYYQNSYGTGFQGRKLLVVDEAHNISNKFTGFLSFTLDSSVTPVPEFDRLSDYDEYVAQMYKELELEYVSLKQLYDAEGMSGDQLKRYKDLGGQLRKMRIFLDERQKKNPAEFVFDYSDYGRNAPRVTFRPVFVGQWARRWLFAYGERVLLMSATILDKEMFCKEVGLNPDEAYYMSVPSTFPAVNRPILKKYAGSMSYKNIEDTLPKIADRIQEIMDKFPTKKGIIQTHSEKTAKYLQNGGIWDRRLTYNKDYPRPQDMLEAHKRKDGSMIVASGLREGLDLRGDLSQIQIFCKVPYPSMGDKVVRRKMEIDPEWYGWSTSVAFVQMLGRSVRSPTEKAVTYILDSGFGFFYKRNKRFIPEYIREAIK